MLHTLIQLQLINTYTIVEAKELTTRSSLTKIRFGNASAAARVLELDDLSVQVKQIAKA